MVMHHLSPASTILLTRLPRTPVDSLHMQHHLLHIISSHAMILTCGLMSPEAQQEMRRRPPPASRHLTMVVCKSTQDSCEPLGHFANKDRYFLTIHLLPAPDIFSWTICQAIYDPSFRTLPPLVHINISTVSLGQYFKLHTILCSVPSLPSYISMPLLILLHNVLCYIQHHWPYVCCVIPCA